MLWAPGLIHRFIVSNLETYVSMYASEGAFRKKISYGKNDIQSSFFIKGNYRFVSETCVANSKVLVHASPDFMLRILECLYIYKKKLKLNDMSSVMPMLVIK